MILVSPILALTAILASHQQPTTAALFTMAVYMHVDKGTPPKVSQSFTLLTLEPPTKQTNASGKATGFLATMTLTYDADPKLFSGAFQLKTEIPRVDIIGRAPEPPYQTLGTWQLKDVIVTSVTTTVAPKIKSVGSLSSTVVKLHCKSVMYLPTTKY